MNITATIEINKSILKEDSSIELPIIVKHGSFYFIKRWFYSVFHILGPAENYFQMIDHIGETQKELDTIMTNIIVDGDKKSKEPEKSKNEKKWFFFRIC